MYESRQFLVRLFFAAVASLAFFDVLAGEALASDGPRAEAYRRYGLDPGTPVESRVRNTPASVIAFMREAGRPDPKSHVLTEAERVRLKLAIQALPPVHRRILRERLRELSFLDGMPNTALTSPVNLNEPYRLLDITVNARIFRQNVSEWLTQKEQTCFDTAGSPLRVNVEAGTKVDALLYVLTHEATHVIDAAEGITPPLSSKRLPSPFTEGVWNELALPVAPYRDPLRAHLRFYTNGDDTIPIDRAPDVYQWLRRTPFVSLYGGRNWLDDLAEFASVYHLTEVLKQPYRIVVRRNDKEIFVYEPMKSDLVRRRLGQMKQFYVGG